ncbi:MAG: hypothetical protein P0Y62_06320 [Candidatus Chryseobacterium colombiense]|nr:hypothetical protein [Chryseobacterium sp.]WEK71168.1 MAG: hypothetical protein P0Y62_06320 [Chryseobacterium sp.]
MKTLITTAAMLLFSLSHNGQVGINTTDPTATLDINGNLKIRTSTSLVALTGNHSILVRDNSITGDHEVKEITATNLALLGSSLVYSAAKSGGWQLIDLSIGGGWYRMNLTGVADTIIGDSSLFTDGTFTAPASGVYMISYELQPQSGLDLGVLTGRKLGVLKNNIVWKDKKLDAVRVNLALGIVEIPISSTTLNTFVRLNANDTLTFVFQANGLLPISLGLVTQGAVNLHIAKVSN